MPRPTHDPTEALAAALFDVDNACGDPECRVHIDECLVHEDGYTRIAVRQAAALSAAGWHLARAGDEELRAALERAIDAMDTVREGFSVKNPDAIEIGAGSILRHAAREARAALDSDR